MKRNQEDQVVKELEKLMRADLHKIGDFKRGHPMPRNGSPIAAWNQIFLPVGRSGQALATEAW
jgi:hypothetical protein